jgi:subtilisin family serine protease
MSYSRRRNSFRNIGVILLVQLLATSILAGCGADQQPAPTPLPDTLITGSKTDSLLADLVLRFNTSGLEATRQLARDGGLLDDQDRVRFGIRLDSAGSAESVKQKLEQLGAITVTSYREYLTARVTIPQLVKKAGEASVWERLAELKNVRDLKILVKPPTTENKETRYYYPGGLESWQQLGYKGNGVKIGIIDSGFGGWQNLAGTALPARDKVIFKSFVFGGGEGSGRHGTAVSEVVHNIAPDAEHYLAVIDDEIGFAQAVDWLLESKVQVLQVSLAWGGLWPSDGSSLLSRKLEEARSKGALPVVSAGNYGQAHYMGRFSPDPSGFHRFASGDGNLTLKVTPLSESVWVSLRWEENWEKPETNLDLYILDENRQPKASSRNLQGENSSKPPVELAPFRAEVNHPYYIQVRQGGTGQGSTRFHLFAYNATLEESNPLESIATPGDARGALTVGAVAEQDNKLEAYSSRGPTLDGRNKPDLVAPSGLSLQSLTAGQLFSGTSASAPQVAAIAAIVWGAVPEMNAGQLEKYLQRNAFSLTEQRPSPSSGYGKAQFGPVEALRGRIPELLGADVTGPPLRDNFADANGGLPDNYQAYYGKLPGGTSGYFVRVGRNSELNWSVYDRRDFGEFRAEFTGWFPGVYGGEGLFFGLIFWQQSPSSYYLFCVSGNRYAVLERDQDNWREILGWQTSPLLVNYEKPPRLALEATAGYLKVRAQGITLQSVTLSNPKIGGKIGFAGGMFSTGASTLFDESKLPLAMFSDMVITPLSSK